MGEMVRNLPPEALQAFKWEEYAKALISSLGFDSRNWVISEEEKNQKIQEEQARQAQATAQQQSQAASTQVMAAAGAKAAEMDLQQNGGQGIANVLQNSGVDMSAFQGGQ